MALAVVLVLAGCSRQEATARGPLSKDVIATVGETAITAEAFEAELGHRGSTTKQAVLDLLVRRELLFAEARRVGFDRSSEMEAAWRSFLINRFADEQRKQLESLPPPTEAEVEAFYHDNLARYTTPERSHLALIYLRHQAGAKLREKEALLAQANTLRQQAVAEGAGADFGSLAASVSDHRASKFSGGDIGWVSLEGPSGAWPAEVFTAMKDLRRAGELSPVIATSQGPYLVKLIEHRPGEAMPFEKVRERVAHELVRDRATAAEEALYSGLKTAFPVRINTQRFEEVRRPDNLAQAAPPRLPVR